MKCIFLVSAGKEEGMGHLMRSIVAARSLDKNFPSITTKFIVLGDPIPSGLMQDFDCEIIERLDINLFDRLIRDFRPELLVIDTYQQRLDTGFMKPLMQSKMDGLKIVAIDGLKGFEDLTDLVYKPSFFNRKIENKTRKNIVYGWDCYLLNTSCDKGGVIKNPHKEVRILVLTGGSDAHGLGKIWPNLLNEIKINSQIIVDWVVGPYSETPAIPDEKNIIFNLHISPGGLGKLMQNADYALTVYGVSLFEILSLKKPTVVYSSISMSEEIRALEKENVALISENAFEAVSCLNSLILDQKKSRMLSENGANKLKSATGDRFSFEIKKYFN